MVSAPRRVVSPPSQPAGLKILIPGYPQWRWRQRERAGVLFGSFASALAVGLFAWGSRAGLAMIALAFLAHVASASDAIRQGAFPGFGRWVPPISAGFGLGLGCYAPALVAASVLAWPDLRDGGSNEGYLINRWAFRTVEPRPGDWVWYRTPGGGFGLGRLVAGPGRSVQWSDDSVRVDGQRLPWSPVPADGSPVNLVMTVPEDRLLIALVGGTPGLANSAGVALVPRDAVVGRAWARLYPVWNRRLLF